MGRICVPAMAAAYGYGYCSSRHMPFKCLAGAQNSAFSDPQHRISCLFLRQKRKALPDTPNEDNAEKRQIWGLSVLSIAY